MFAVDLMWFSFSGWRRPPISTFGSHVPSTQSICGFVYVGDLFLPPQRKEGRAGLPNPSRAESGGGTPSEEGGAQKEKTPVFFLSSVCVTPADTYVNRMPKGVDQCKNRCRWHETTHKTPTLFCRATMVRSVFYICARHGSSSS